MIAARNNSLQRAKKTVNDEFYTQLGDIENELRHYKQHLVGKTIYSNCDDPRVSRFFHYFSYNFEQLGLKKVIATCYKSQDLDLFSTGESERAVFLEYSGDRNSNKVPDIEEIKVQPLMGDGDFRSQESIELLKEADVVVTNPPFSLFGEFVQQLISHDKKFIIIGPQNNITHKEIFPLIMDNKMWLGNGFQAGNAYFSVPPGREYAAGVYDEKRGLVKFRNVAWFTNLDIQKRHEELVLYKKYSPAAYQKYDDFDAIEVSTLKDIPMDYAGIMGVPITFIEKYNPDQFEIVGNIGSYAPDGYSLASKIHINGKKLFKRIAIRHRKT